jgi:hypothetical protein
MKKTRQAGLVVLGAFMAASSSAYATMALQKKAKELEYPATSCTYCHVEKIPKKGATTYAHRGKWLMAEKEKRKAAAVDAAWLKDYVDPEAKPAAK